jgi:hypothetical protein
MCNITSRLLFVANRASLSSASLEGCSMDSSCYKHDACCSTHRQRDETYHYLSICRIRKGVLHNKYSRMRYYCNST